jgi:hypothetical protein
MAAFRSPVFQAVYYRDYLPVLHTQNDGTRQEVACLRCHAPLVFLASDYERAWDKGSRGREAGECADCHPDSDGRYNGLFDRGPESSASLLHEEVPLWTDGYARHFAPEGVSCEFCHTATKYRGKTPGSGNYVCDRTSDAMFGPFKTDRYHQEYSELHTSSDFCAMCHQAENRHGVEYRSTFLEWKRGPYSRTGVSCQDCHMSATGYLVDGRPSLEAGRAAQANMIRSPEREKLYSHYFFGDDAPAQLEAALTLELNYRPEGAKAEGQLPFEVLVANVGAGHHLPTGSASHSLWLEVVGASEQEQFRGILGDDASSYAVLGAMGIDQDRYRHTLAEGARVYRVILQDGDGRETLSSWEAESVVFDNRIEAGETRREWFLLSIPEGVGGVISVTAKAYYMKYPDSFLEGLGLEPGQPVLVASSTLQVDLD